MGSRRLPHSDDPYHVVCVWCPTYRQSYFVLLLYDHHCSWGVHRIVGRALSVNWHRQTCVVRLLVSSAVCCPSIGIVSRVLSVYWYRQSCVVRLLACQSCVVRLLASSAVCCPSIGIVSRALSVYCEILFFRKGSVL